VSLPQRREEFVEAVVAELRQLGLGSLAVANLPADSETTPALRAAAKKMVFTCTSDRRTCAGQRETVALL
jgi:hypothetical protein